MGKLLSQLSRFVMSPIQMPLVAIPIMMLLTGGGALYLVKSNPSSVGLATKEVAGVAKGVSSEESSGDLISEVGKLMALPGDEVPTIATVSDIEKVKAQPFFKNAQNGDKVLIYTNNKKAIIYRPSEKRIIEVGVASSNSGQTGTDQEGNLGKLRFVLYNGTKTAGLTRVYDKELLKVYPDAEIVERSNATLNYDKTVLVDLGQRKDLAEQAAKALGISLQNLPSGETKPSAGDFLIIIGSDKTTVSEPTP